MGNDILRMDYINSLPRPLSAELRGSSKMVVGVIDIEVQTAMMRVDVMGMVDLLDLLDARWIIDDEGVKHDPYTFFVDYEDEVQVQGATHD